MAFPRGNLHSRRIVNWASLRGSLFALAYFAMATYYVLPKLPELFTQSGVSGIFVWAFQLCFLILSTGMAYLGSTLLLLKYSKQRYLNQYYSR